MAKEILARHVGDFFSNPVYRIVNERLEGIRTQAYQGMSKALKEGDADLAKSLGGKADGVEAVLIMLQDVQKGLKMQIRKKKEEYIP